MITIGNLVVPKEIIKLAILFLAAALFHQLALRIFMPLFKKICKKTTFIWDDILIKRKVIRRAFHLLPATVLSFGLPIILKDRTGDLYVILSKGITLYYISAGFLVYIALLDAVQDLYEMSVVSKKFNIRGLLQALKVVGVLSLLILVISQLAGRSPVYFLSGLGAFTAILLLIFKDALLGLVAGIQLSAMDLVRKGDWIEMPKHGADGDVIDISLTTVRVQNWDKTISSIPAYELVSASFKNWRGMSECGGRRIKRAIHIDLQTIGFLNADTIARLKRIKIISKYISEKLSEIEKENLTAFNNDELQCSGNGRRLTNLGTFRAYCVAYLRNHPQIHQKMTFLVRQLAPDQYGLPLEIYVFTSITDWALYEDIQSDIFDHLLAILPEFNLKVFQAVSGEDIARGVKGFIKEV